MHSVADHAARFLLWISQTTLQAGLLICLILMVRALMGRRLPSRWQYALWLLICCKVLVPWAPENELSLQRVLPDLAQTAPARAVLSHASDATGRSGQLPPVFGQGPLLGPLAGANRLNSHAAAPALPASSDEFVQRGLFWGLGAMWLLGALLLTGRIVYTHLQLWWAVRHEPILTKQSALDLLEKCREQLGISAPVSVIATRAVPGPALFGLLRPRLLLPAGLIHSFSRRQLCHIFLHELAHLRRHDIACNWIVALCQILHWFNPLVWLGFHLMRTDREMACDQLALSRLKPAQSRYYGLTIIRLLERRAQRPRLAGLASISQDPGQLRRRIKTIAQFKSHAERLQVVPVLITVCLIIMGLTNAQNAQVRATLENQVVPAPLYPPTPPERTRESTAVSNKPVKTAASPPAPETTEAPAGQDEPAGESTSGSEDINPEASPPPIQEPTEIHPAPQSDSHSPAQTWGTAGGGFFEIHEQFNLDPAQPQRQIRVRHHSATPQPGPSSRGFIKMFGGDMNRSVLGVLNAREFGFGRPPKNRVRMLHTLVPPTWPAFVQRIDLRVMQISRMIPQSGPGRSGNTVQRNLTDLVSLNSYLVTALGADLNGPPSHPQGATALQEIHLRRFRRSLASVVADPVQLIQLKKHSLRMAQISQRLYNVLDRGPGPGTQRLYQNLLEEWARLKSTVPVEQGKSGS